MATAAPVSRSPVSADCPTSSSWLWPQTDRLVGVAIARIVRERLGDPEGPGGDLVVNRSGIAGNLSVDRWAASGRALGCRAPRRREPPVPRGRRCLDDGP